MASPADSRELQAMVEDKVREEVLYREAFGDGSRQGRHHRETPHGAEIQSLAEDVAAAHEPFTAELRAWFEKNTDKFALPSRYSFRHLYFSPESGARTPRKRRRGVEQDRQPAGRCRTRRLVGRSFMFQDYYGDRAPSAFPRSSGRPLRRRSRS